MIINTILLNNLSWHWNGFFEYFYFHILINIKIQLSMLSPNLWWTSPAPICQNVYDKLDLWWSIDMLWLLSLLHTVRVRGNCFLWLQGVQEFYDGNKDVFSLCQTCVNSLLTCVMDVFIVAGVIVSAWGHQNN